MYQLKKDANGVSLQNGISKIEQVEIDATVELTNYEVVVPEKTYAIVVKQSEQNLRLTINSGEVATNLLAFEGDYLGEIIPTVNRLQISSPASAKAIVVHFII